MDPEDFVQSKRRCSMANQGRNDSVMANGEKYDARTSSAVLRWCRRDEGTDPKASAIRFVCFLCFRRYGPTLLSDYCSAACLWFGFAATVYGCPARCPAVLLADFNCCPGSLLRLNKLETHNLARTKSPLFRFAGFRLPF